MPGKLSALTGAALFFYPLIPGFAQQLREAPHSGPGLEEVVVTSSRLPTPLRQIGTSVAVLTEAEIEAHGNLALVDVLRQMPGSGSSSSGGAGIRASRGAGSTATASLARIGSIRLVSDLTAAFTCAS